jgi:penicillin-binding protein 2
MSKLRDRYTKEMDVEEVLLDASNRPGFNRGRLEGKREIPITKRNVITIWVLFLLITGAFSWKLFNLQIVHGEEFRTIAENNSVAKAVIIAERGVIFDRTGEMLAWNEVDESGEYDFPIRAYTDRAGLGQVLGYVSYPKKDSRGYFFRTDYLGRSGAELAFDVALKGKNGSKIIEADALNDVVSEFAIEAPEEGQAVQLSIDAELSEAMYDIIATSSAQAGFRSGAGVIMNVHTGEILALTSFPSYDPEVMADGDDIALIAEYNDDDRLPFLNKVIGGVMTMREAIAFSSNVYFYIIGGGFGDQEGIGITKMAENYRRFGMGELTGINLAQEQAGVVPDPAWKREVFDDDWRLGDTYFTAIGQFGFLVTPIQMVRAYAALANGGYLVDPHALVGHQSEKENINLNPDKLQIIHEGMRKTVNFPGGTARGLERSDVAVAAKSGTAEIGAGNAYVNSWAAGFWPYEEPEYAFILMMDKAPRSNSLGATTIMGKVVGWMAENRPEYLGIEVKEESENKESEQGVAEAGE